MIPLLMLGSLLLALLAAAAVFGAQQIRRAEEEAFWAKVRTRPGLYNWADDPWEL